MARFGKCGITFPNLTSTIIITICVQHLTFVICYAIIPCCYIIFNYYFIYSTCDETLSTCGSWESKSIDLSDCESIQDGAEEKLCNHLNTWRITGILSLIAVLIGGGLVFAASCCQMVTCGCCGLSNVLFWIEVILSIVTWAFTISSLNLVKDGANMVSDSGYQWGFWLYILCGTIIGALSAWMADWASEDSCLRGVWYCILCKHCRKKSSNDEKNEPLIPGESL